MTPCDLNMIVAALTNHFYTSLSPEDFKCLTIFLNELSKSMFATLLFQDICDRDGKEKIEGKAELEKKEKKDP